MSLYFKKYGDYNKYLQAIDKTKVPKASDALAVDALEEDALSPEFEGSSHLQ